MAIDWIKMRTDLYRDPKVCVMADRLLNPKGELGRYINQHCQRDIAVTRNVMRNAVVGALVTLWGVCRHQGKRVGDDLLLAGVSESVIDDISELHGLGEAMAAVGWAVDHEDGIVFPAFFKEYNTDPTLDAKAQNAERQRRFRESKRNALRNVTVTPNSNAREEKEKEKEKENTHTQLEPKVAKLFQDWLEHVRLKTGQAVNEIERDVLLMEVLRRGEQAADDIQFSIMRGCKTLQRASDDWQKLRADAERSKIRQPKLATVSNKSKWDDL